MDILCRNCGHVWDYKGKSEYYVTCPQCLHKVSLSKPKPTTTNSLVTTTRPPMGGITRAILKPPEADRILQLKKELANAEADQKEKMALIKTQDEKVAEVKDTQIVEATKTRNDQIVEEHKGIPEIHNLTDEQLNNTPFLMDLVPAIITKYGLISSVTKIRDYHTATRGYVRS